MRLAPGSRVGERIQRGQSSPIGVVLILAILMAGATLIVALGGQAMTDTYGQLDTERAEKTLTQLDSQTAMVAIGDSNVQQVALTSQSGGQFGVRDDSGWMNVSYVNTSTREVTTVYNESMGAVVYEEGTTEIAYQGGGVWRTDGEGSVMVSPPEFHYRDATLTLPMVAVSGDRSIDGRATITHDETTRYYPNRSIDDSFVNPLQHGKVNVTVHSPYYYAWGHYFAQRTDGDVHYDHDRERVTTTLTVPVGPRRVHSAVQASTASGTVTFEGSTDPGIDAYNSSDGDGYAGEGSANGWNNGTLQTGGDVTVQDNGVDIYGNVSAGGAVDVKDWSVFHGERVEYGESLNPSPYPFGVETEQISGIDDPTHIDGPINERVKNVRNNNDNAGTVSGDAITSSQTIGDDPGPQRYYVEHVDLGSGETLTVDTSDGNVTVAVRDYVRLDQASIEVDGTNEVRFYVQGENSLGTHNPPSGDPVDTHFLVTGGSVQTVGAGPAENATQVWFYGKSDFGAVVYKDSDDPEITGVVYAPGSDSHFAIRNGDLYGGVVVNEAKIHQKGAVHFDEALVGQQAVPEAQRTTKVTYLHISVNRVNVTSG